MTTPQDAAQTATRPAPASSSLSGAGRDKPMFYGEQKTLYGAWMPVRLAEPPVVDERGRQVRAAGVGPIMRKFGGDYCKRIPDHLAHLSLDQLYAVLSPDGHLAATRKGGA